VLLRIAIAAALADFRALSAEAFLEKYEASHAPALAATGS